MKNTFIFLAVLLLTVSISSCSKDDNDPNSYKLLKKRFMSNNLQSEITYDNDDLPLRLNSYNSNGELLGYITYDFGSDKYVDKLNYYNAKDELTNYISIEYDKVSRLLNQKFYKKYSTYDQLESIINYEYNDQNQCVKIRDLDSVGNLNYYIDQVIDNEGNPIEKKYFAPDGSYVGSAFYTYDSKKPSYYGYWKKLYDINPQLKHNILSVSSNLADTDGIVYFSFGNYSASEGIRTCVYEYDKSDHVVSEKITNKDSSVKEYSYEYY